MMIITRDFAGVFLGSHTFLYPIKYYVPYLMIRISFMLGFCLLVAQTTPVRYVFYEPINSSKSIETKFLYVMHSLYVSNILFWRIHCADKCTSKAQKYVKMHYTATYIICDQIWENQLYCHNQWNCFYCSIS